MNRSEGALGGAASFDPRLDDLKGQLSRLAYVRWEQVSENRFDMRQGRTEFVELPGGEMIRCGVAADPDSRLACTAPVVALRTATMRVAITGANGLLGREAVALLDGRHEILAIGRGPCRLRAGAISWADTDLGDSRSVETDCVVSERKPCSMLAPQRTWTAVSATQASLGGSTSAEPSR
jgi:hypothetical protein